ncbi:MAG TPA: methyltransferase domain-containing protein [Vicinamibacterales bacterium]|nr:methyltransferase domain-containing protein [Vicinamibacterales bacterium]
MSSADPQLSIVAVQLERTTDPAAYLDQLRGEVEALGVPSETIVVPAGRRGFGYELRSGLRQARGAYIITVDPDFSGPMTFLGDLWARRHEAEVVIASRYVEGSRVAMPASRHAGSRLLNIVFRRGLSLGVQDGSSAIRLYRSDAVRSLPLQAEDYDILQEVLVRAYADGWRVLEIPFHYAPNPQVPSKAHAALARAYLRTFYRLWKLRNSIAAADYDYRAHDSPIPLQRYWQRSRYRHIVELIEGQGAVLDVGCGSSHIIGALPRGSVALDVLVNKLRFARRFPTPRVRASGLALPFASELFPCVLCSQVIEHVPMVPSMIDELCRVLKPGGRLVLGTPDYDRWEWVWIEKAYALAAPGGYADEHISHYTRKGLLELFARRGYVHEATRYILRGELILAFRKPAR